MPAFSTICMYVVKTTMRARAVQFLKKHKAVLALGATMLVAGSAKDFMQNSKYGKELGLVSSNALAMVEQHRSNFAAQVEFIQSQMGKMQAEFDYTISTVRSNAQAQVDLASGQVNDLSTKLDAANKRLEPNAPHPHAYGLWSETKQVVGNYVIPQFYHSRTCKICGTTDTQKVAKP